MNEIIPSGEDCREAIEAAFDDYHKLEWVDSLSEDDLRDMAKKAWVITYRRYSGPEEKYLAMKAQFEACADPACKQYAEKNWMDYL